MLLRICLVLTILAGLGTAYVGFFPVQDMIKTTREARDKYHHDLDSETALYKKTDKELKSTKTQLATTTTKLNETAAQLEAANTKNAELDKQNTDLTDKLTKQTARADADDQLLEAYRGLPTPPEIKKMMTDLDTTRKSRDSLIAENKILASSRDDYKARYEELVNPDNPVPLPTGLKGNVVAVDPKYDFVVLNIGDDQGVKRRGEMMINRKGKLIGKVRITSVQKDTSVASILPAWRKGEVMEGDQVLY
jgi:hypothetical protein